MKRRDLTIIITAAIVAGVFSYLISNLLFGGQKAYKLTTPKVDVISDKFSTPDSKYFNSSSIDLTKVIKIGDGSNSNPKSN